MNNNGNRTLILTGFMACGKTTFGQWLAARTGLAFLDTDELIVRQEGESIPSIFKERGESCFRDLETGLLREMSEKKIQGILSVGGGLPMREQNRQLLRQIGTVVYLQTSLDELLRRLEQDHQSRPVLQAQHGDGLRRRIAALMQEREQYYLQGADYVLSTDGKSFETMYQELQKGTGIK